MLHGPTIPCRAVVVLLHEDPEKCVIMQPCSLLFAKFLKTRLPFFAGAIGEIRECFLKQTPFQFFDVAIFDTTAAQPAKACPRRSRRIDICQRGIKVLAR